jgi:hypothetical protein
MVEHGDPQLELGSLLSRAKFPRRNADGLSLSLTPNFSWVLVSFCESRELLQWFINWLIDWWGQRVYKLEVSGGVVPANGFLSEWRVVSRRQQAVSTTKPPPG